MEIVCPACNAKVYGSRIQTYKSELSNKEYSLYHCSKCDLQFWQPMKIIPAIYEEALEWQYDLKHDSDYIYPKNKIIKSKYSFIKKIPIRKGTLLDIGCANGAFLKYANELGYDTWGIDIDRISIEAAKKIGLQNVFSMSLEEFVLFATQKNIFFDVITLWDVLEHLDDIREYVDKSKQLLKKDGYIVGTIPNRNRLFAEASRINTTGDYPPHHFTWWSSRSLINFLNGEGFRNIKIIYLPNSLQNVIVNLQKKISLLERIKGILKRMISKREDSEKLPLEYIEFSQKKSSASLKLLKQIRNIIFFPIALIVYPFGRNKSKMFFQAQKNKNK
jgi:2-polyprenyl-3-methyl-5-hydroxy-6-metoxy-1,4-benzoquinol methylase